MTKKIIIKEDWHIHSHFSGCSNDPEQNVQNICHIAVKANLSAIGFADHLWQNPDKSTWPEDLAKNNHEIIAELREEIANANIPSDLQVFLGAEAEMTGFNQFSITKDFAETLDFVLMPHNHIHQNYIKKPAICTAENLINFLLDRFSICAKSGLATIMAHPMLPYGFMEFFAPGILNCSEQKMIDIYGLAAERNIFFELNSDYFSQANSPEQHEAILKIINCAKCSGCRFTYGSDAHHPQAISAVYINEIAKTAEEAGLLQEDFASIGDIIKRKI